MRVVSWNLHGAPGQGTNREQVRAWHHLAALDPDIALLQEVRESAIPDWVRGEWDLCIGVIGKHGKGIGWGSVIAARPELRMRDLSDELPDGSWLGVVYDYVVLAEVTLGDTAPTLVASVHTPAVSAAELLQNLGKPGAIPDEMLASIAIEPDPPFSTDVAFEALDEIKGSRFIFGGDWNAARLFDRGRAVPTNALFFARAASRGWVEAMSGENEQRSFLRPGTRPYQLDHIFVDAASASTVQSCAVWADPPIAEISDHAPLVLDLGTEAASP